MTIGVGAQAAVPQWPRAPATLELAEVETCLALHSLRIASALHWGSGTTSLITWMLMLTQMPAPWQGLEKLTSLIFAKALPKQLGRQVLTGSVLAALTSAYVDAINGGAVPTITTAWQV